MIIYQIITFIFLFVLLFIPNQGEEYFASLSIIGLLSISLLPVFIKNIWKNIQNRDLATISFVLFIAASLISTVFSVDRESSVIQLLFFTSCFVIFTSVRSIFLNQKRKELFAICYLIAATILSTISLYNTLVVHNVSRTYALSFMWSYYGHNHLSAILLFALPISIYFLWKNWKKKLLRYIFLSNNVYLLLAFFFTFARASIFSLFLSTAIAIVLFVRRRFSPRIIIFIRVAIMVFFLLFGILTGANFIAKKTPFRLDETNMRIIYWQQAVTNFRSHFLFGSGLDTFKLMSYLPAYLKDNNYLRSNYVHNFFLQMLSDAGILGFLASIKLILSVLRRGVQKIAANSAHAISEKYLSIAFFVGISASILNSMVDFDWQIPVVFLVFWIIAGLI